jgi:hypothetical protein
MPTLATSLDDTFSMVAMNCDPPFFAVAAASSVQMRGIT